MSPGAAAGAVLLLITGAAQVAFGALAITGFEQLEANVREIERNPIFGELYIGLGTWGVLLAVIGLGQLAAGWRMLTQAPHARLFGLAATLFGLALAFFTLALFRAASIATIFTALAALYVLSYRVSE